MAHHYLIDAANRIHAISGETFEPDLDGLRKAFTIGCNTLERLEVDKAFRDDVELLSKRAGLQRRDCQAILGEVEHFVHGFLQIERKAMENAGCSPITTNYVLTRAEALRAISHGDLPPLEPSDVYGQITSLRAAVCATAKELHASAKASGKPKSSLRRKLEALTLGVTGSAVIFVNASTAAATLGLSAAGSAVSGVIGGGFVKEAFSHYKS